MSDNRQLLIENLSKRYGSRTVLDIDRLSLDFGRSYALIGPNGSGKSTLLKALSGVTDASSGTISVPGASKASRLSVGYMPQKSYVFGLSVFRNVAMALDSTGITRSEVRRRVEVVLEEVGMLEFIDSRGDGLSGGEAQRIAIARMLVQDRDVLLLDEPTASMDITGTMLAEEALKRYQKRTGCLAIVATHAPSQARRIADEIVMLSDGRVVEQGATKDVLSHPSSEEGQRFLSYWAI